MEGGDMSKRIGWRDITDYRARGLKWKTG